MTCSSAAPADTCRRARRRRTPCPTPTPCAGCSRCPTSPRSPAATTSPSTPWRCGRRSWWGWGWPGCTACRPLRLSAGPVARVDQSAVEGTLLDQLEIEAHAATLVTQGRGETLARIRALIKEADPDVVEEVDFESIFGQMLADLRARDPAFDALVDRLHATPFDVDVARQSRYRNT